MTTVIFDVGKTNLKLLAIDAGRVVDRYSVPNRGSPGPPYPHHDLVATEAWLLAALRELAARHAVGAVATTAHGSAGVLVDDTGPALPMVDYEAPAPDWLHAAYAAVAPTYLERGSRTFGGMAHLGRQAFFLARAFPDEFARARSILALVAAMGWERLLPPLRPGHAVLGTITAPLAAATGLPARTPVLNGMHDSSANLYRYQEAGLGDAALLSTGTWLAGLNPRLPPGRLVEERAMTLNADVAGRLRTGARPA